MSAWKSAAVTVLIVLAVMYAVPRIRPLDNIINPVG